METDSGAFGAAASGTDSDDGNSGASRSGMQAHGGPLPGASMEMVRPPAYGRGIFVSLGCSAAVFALAIMASGGKPNSTGVPLSETTTPLFWGLAVILVALTAIGAQYSEVMAARASEAMGGLRFQRPLPTAWAVPAVAAMTAVLMVATYHNRVMLAVGPAMAFIGVAGGLLARDLLDDATDSTLRTASTIHTLAIHTVAFFALSAIYINKMSNLIAVPLVALVSGLLILEALERGAALPEQRVLYASLGAFVMAQTAIGVNWWPTHGWTGGAALLVCFFAICGVLVTRTERTSLRQRDLLEYGLVSIVGLAILALTL